MITEHIAALTLEWIREHEQNESYKGTPVKYAQHLQNSFMVSASVFQMRDALEMLVSAGCCRSTPSPLTGGFYSTNWHWGKRYFESLSLNDLELVRQNDPDRYAMMSDLREKFPVLSAYYEGGEEWAAEVGEVLAASSDLDTLDRLSSGSEMVVPAADRIVTINDNKIQQKFDVKIEQLIVQIGKDNTVGDVIGDDRSRIVGELEAGRSLIKAGKFTTRAMLATAFAALTFLASNFAESAVGELATALIDLLKPYIGL